MVDHLTFFKAKHENLRHDYSDGSGEFVDSCALVAFEMAELLQAEGREPTILTVHGERIDTTGNRASLSPIPFDGRVQWGAHVICESNGFVYDPMIQTPLPLNEYLSAAFSQNVEIEVHSRIKNR